MSEELNQPPNGQSLSQTMKDLLRQEATQKQLEQKKATVSVAVVQVIQALTQAFCTDENHAIQTILTYASGLAIATNTPKDRVLAGLDEIWIAQEKASVALREQQGSALIDIARGMISREEVFPAGLVMQLEALRVEIPSDVREWTTKYPPVVPQTQVVPAN